MKNDIENIKEIILNWTSAISAENRQDILLNHSKDILMYDFPSVVQGLDAYDRTWDFFFSEKKKQILFEPRELEVTADSSVAFATCLIRCEGTSAGGSRVSPYFRTSKN